MENLLCPLLMKRCMNGLLNVHTVKVVMHGVWKGRTPRCNVVYIVLNNTSVKFSKCCELLTSFVTRTAWIFVLDSYILC